MVESIEVGVVLAGGRSRRMGEDKADLLLEGETLLDRAVALLESRFSEVLVAGGERGASGAVLVPDLVPHSGPLGGISSALDHAGRDVFVMPVDVPALTLETIRRLSVPLSIDGQVRVARVDGRIHPLLGTYPHDQLERMQHCLESEDRSVIGFLRGVPVLTLVDISDGSVRDVNTPADWASIRET